MDVENSTRENSPAIDWDAQLHAQSLQLASFNGTLAFSRLALIAVLVLAILGVVVNIPFWTRVNLVTAVAAIGAAYWSQSLSTHGDDAHAVAWQIGSIALALLAVGLFLAGA
jgi:uncharacterized membrane protein